MAATLPLAIPDQLNPFLEGELNKELLRFTTAGSVDDGKSTLIGRLLHDCKAVYEDQLDAVKKSRINRSGKAIDFSLLTDGLRAEREQGITIDVAYRYFSTPRRKFIIADTPGHEEYTRNMATGASTADLAVILVDATKGLLQQTRRHAYIASLLGISSVLAAVNKMDLLEFREDVFLRLEAEFSELAGKLGISNVRCVPVSALDGDNVVARSERTPWYFGPTLLEHLETVPVQAVGRTEALRFPVQSVIRPDASFRGFAGRVASGTAHQGDEVLALPSGQKTCVESIVTFDGNLESAGPAQSVVLKLADEIDLSRGDLLVSAEEQPHVSNRFSAMLVWLHHSVFELNRQYLAKHAGRVVKLTGTRIRFRMDVNELEKRPANDLKMNEIALVEFSASQALYFDSYKRNRTTGSLILIDPLTNATVGALMIRESLASVGEDAISESAVTELERQFAPELAERVRRRGYRPAVVMVAGDRSTAAAMERDLLEHGFEAVLIDHGEIPAGARRAFFDALWNLGIVVIAWSGTPLEQQERELLTEVAGESAFDFSAVETQAGAEIRVRALRIAQTLRVGTASTNR